MASLRKRNDKWQAQVRRTGHTPISKTFINRADALRWIRQTEQELDRSALAYDPSALQRMTVADLLRRYARDVTPGKRGHASEAKRIEVFLRYDWANLTLARITPQAFTRYRDKRLREVEGGTVLRELGLLRTVFEIARREWDIPLQANPIANVRRPKAATGRNRRLHADEFAALLAACADGRNDWLEPGIKLAIETGMRRGELLNIRRSNLDLANGLLSIPETKTDIPRTIPLSEKAVLILRSLQDTGTEDRLFPVSANAFRLAWERCKHRAAKHKPGIVDLRFHDLRHEAVSRFFELGLNVPEVAAISGHRDPRMLFRYTHLKPEDIVAKLRQAGRQVAA
ncbi:site-specific integrase [bacterium M00.F.Ca.ET.227.01.1.1]|nr:site-specific integrase [bacterium M00.F.Ca.ET.227.01.1.1]TGU38895.1 site-specific integrase [bacterium M00.F.Ca.ET.156.01.1.1]